ncbi:hypothetical protein C2U70_14550 [Bradyrhizobium guangdongense]|nr:hypothetical protein C2U70_14550 [Bradyrhizobium guangdongense]
MLRSLGIEMRPPFPKGHVLPDGDWTLLDPVKARGGTLRRAPSSSPLVKPVVKPWQPSLAARGGLLVLAATGHHLCGPQGRLPCWISRQISPMAARHRERLRLPRIRTGRCWTPIPMP